MRGYTARDPEWTQNALLGAITNLAQCGIRDALELKARALRSLQAAAAREPRVGGRTTWSAAGLNCTTPALATSQTRREGSYAYRNQLGGP